MRKTVYITVWLMASIVVGAQAMPAAGPAAHSTAANRTLFSAEQDVTNVLTLGLGFSAEYDDNVFQSLQNGISQTLYTVTPEIGWKVTRPHWNWALDYRDSEGWSTSIAGYNRSSHSAEMDVAYRVTPRLTFSVRDSFIRSNDPFYGSGSSLTSGVPLGDQPNASWFGTNRRTSEQVSADVSYLLSARTTAGVGGSYLTQSFDSVAGAPNLLLQDFYNVSGNGYVQHQFSQRNTLGVSYDFRKLTSPSGWDTVAHRPSIYETFAWDAKNSLSVFAGPECTTTTLPAIFALAGIATRSQGWSWSAGATYAWSGQRTGLTAGLIRQTSDGGGLTGSVHLTAVNFGVRRQLTRKLVANVNGGFDLNDALMPSAVFSGSFKYGTASASLNWAVRSDLAIGVSYTRQEQTTITAINGFPWIDRNHVSVSVNYTFNRPLGR